MPFVILHKVSGLLWPYFSQEVLLCLDHLLCTPSFLQATCLERLFKDLKKQNVKLLFCMGFGLHSPCAFSLLEHMILLFFFLGHSLNYLKSVFF